MQAVILAGGVGARLRPYTMSIPKPLIPVNEYPILDIIIRQLRYYSVSEIVISTGYLAELIEAYSRKGSKWGVKIRYVHENKPLGTAGALKNITKLEDNFMVMNGDLLTDLNYCDLFKFHLSHKASATIATIKQKVVSDFGIIESDKNFSLTRYVEKPSRIEKVSIGINIFNKCCKKYIAKNESIGIPELIRRMQAKNKKILCYNADCHWFDIGKISDFEKVQKAFIKNKNKFLR